MTFFLLNQSEDIAMRQEFYIVWGEKRNIPVKRHFTRKNAKKEAERLAKKHTGEGFYVFISTDFFIKTDPPVFHEDMSL